MMKFFELMLNLPSWITRMKLLGKYILKRLNGIQSQSPLDCVMRRSTMIEVCVDSS